VRISREVKGVEWGCWRAVIASVEADIEPRNDLPSGETTKAMNLSEFRVVCEILFIIWVWMLFIASIKGDDGRGVIE